MDNPVVMTVLVVVVKWMLPSMLVYPILIPVDSAGTMWLRFAVMSYGLLLVHCREWPVVYLLRL